LTLAVQADGSAIRTVEGLAPGGEEPLHPLQAAFHEHHALQCGYCTPGFLMSIEPFLPELRGASDREVREHLSGNLCRCTGYQNIVEATQAAAAQLEVERADAPARRAALDVTLELPAGALRAWEAVTDPRGMLDTLGVSGLASAGPTGWRGRLATGTATVEGVLELIDLDDDREVANFAVQGREHAGTGQVRGSVTLSLDQSTVAIGLDLELIGMTAVVDDDDLRQRLRRAGQTWIDDVCATQPARVEVVGGPPSRTRLPLLAIALGVASAAWLGWRARKRHR
jgi:hypothetical protein